MNICLYQSKEHRVKIETRAKNERQNHSKIKDILIVHFNYLGIVCHEFLLPAQIINKDYYLSIIRDIIRQNLLDLWITLRFTAPSHTTLILRVFLAENVTHIIQQPPYSPDLTSDYLLNSNDIILSWGDKSRIAKGVWRLFEVLGGRKRRWNKSTLKAIE